MMEKSSINIFDENFEYIEKQILEAAQKSGRKREDIILLAATKTVSSEVINHAIEKGIKYIGENRVQEFLSKEDELNPELFVEVDVLKLFFVEAPVKFSNIFEISNPLKSILLDSFKLLFILFVLFKLFELFSLSLL